MGLGALTMSEIPLEKLVPEDDFARLLAGASDGLFLRARALFSRGDAHWGKRDLFELHSEADELEICLDDYGARWNSRYHFFTELTASIRGFSLAGLSLEHLHRRLEGYGIHGHVGPDEGRALGRGLGRGRDFVRRSLETLLKGLLDEASAIGIDVAQDPAVYGPVGAPPVNFRLPRTLGIQDLADEDQRIAEVASKYLQACKMLGQAGLTPCESADQRDEILVNCCREEHARVFEATVHNLQSAYDTHIKNTGRESSDPRLLLLRGHISTCLHLLQAVTQLVHFMERHESDERRAEDQERIIQLIRREEVTDVVLNTLLERALWVLDAGRSLAEELLPSYTDVRSVTVELPAGVTLHARPIALIVAVVNHHGTPVEISIGGEQANAGSILEVMILSGSQADARKVTFKGDARPLGDLRELLEAGAGEQGLAHFSENLRYLRG